MSAMWAASLWSVFDPVECSWFVEERGSSCSGSCGVYTSGICLKYGSCGEDPYESIGMRLSSLNTSEKWRIAIAKDPIVNNRRTKEVIPNGTLFMLNNKSR